MVVQVLLRNFLGMISSLKDLRTVSWLAIKLMSLSCEPSITVGGYQMKIFTKSLVILIASCVRGFIKFRGFLVDLSETIHIQVLE